MAEAATAHLLRASEVTLYRHGEPVFPPCSIRLPAGRCLLVTGPNGSGKTTLLKLLAGILRPAQGDIERTECAFVGHLPAIKRDLTCLENLQFAAAIAGGDQVAASPPTALKRLGLHRLSGRQAYTLSAGQVKRLSLARLLVSPAPLWLLDEPYASLDHEGAGLVDGLLGTHLGNGGAAVLSTHLQRPAPRIPIDTLDLTR